MRRNDEVDQDRTEEYDMLNRMHRQARPWANIHVLMMQRMGQKGTTAPNEGRDVSNKNAAR